MIIGFIGFIGSGKNIASDILADNHRFVRESFAKPVKDAVASIFGWDRKLLEGDTDFSRKWRETPDSWWSSKIGKEFTPRLALQLMGTEAGRDVFSENIWVDAMFRRLDPGLNYVISDVRFPNEIKMIRESGGKIYRITRGKNPPWYDLAIKVSLHQECTMNSKEDSDLLDEMYKVHYSERAWIGSEVDGEITNDGTLDELRNSIDILLYKLILNSKSSVKSTSEVDLDLC